MYFSITLFILEEVIEKWNKVLEEAEVEEEKRDLITREIGKFREIMKVSTMLILLCNCHNFFKEFH